MKFLLIGRGKMGRLLKETALANGDEVVGMLGSSDVAELSEMGKVADVVIDFSRPESLPEVCDYVRRTGTPLLSGTTGYTAAEMAQLKALGACAPVLWSANFSLGVAVLYRALRVVSDVLKPDFDIEIVETHHNRKADAPSGTALMLGRAVQTVRPDAVFQLGRSGMGKRTREEIGFHAIRRGNVPGIHEVIVSTDTQAITLRHEVYDRALFADGALSAARFLAGKAPGLYDMTAIIRD